MSLKIIAMTLGFLLVIAAFDACAQWTPGKTVVYMGELNLMRSSGSSASMPIMIDSNSDTSGSLAAVGTSAVSEPSMSNTTINSSSVSGTGMNNSSVNATVNASVISEPSPSPQSSMIDLSRYSTDRRDKNLAGYKNIMYPFAESRGSTSSTAGAGGCGCG